MVRKKYDIGSINPLVIVGIVAAGVLIIPKLVKGSSMIPKAISPIIPTKVPPVIPTVIPWVTLPIIPSGTPVITPSSVVYDTYNQALANVTPGGGIGYSSSKGGYYPIPREDLVSTSSVPYAGAGDEVVYPPKWLPGYIPLDDDSSGDDGPSYSPSDSTSPDQPEPGQPEPEPIIDEDSIWWGYMD